MIVLVMAAIIAVFIIAPITAFIIAPPETIEDHVEKALDFLLQYEAEYESMDMASIFLMSEVGERAGSQELRQKMDAIFETYNGPDSIYKKLLDPSYGAEDFENSGYLGTASGNAVLRGIYCNDYPLETKHVDDIKNIDDGGYDTAHALLGLYFAKERGCFDGAVLEDAMDVLSDRIVSDQEGESFSDIFAERTAVLLMTGYPEKVRSEWIHEIANNQSEDGSWCHGGECRGNNLIHTTGFSAIALIEYNR